MRRVKEKCSQMCINCVLTIFTWILTIALVAPVASVTATINTKYVLNNHSQEGERKVAKLSTL